MMKVTKFLNKLLEFVPELTLLIVMIVSMFIALSKIHITPTYVNQFKTFEELVNSTVLCPDVYPSSENDLSATAAFKEFRQLENLNESSLHNYKTSTTTLLSSHPELLLWKQEVCQVRPDDLREVYDFDKSEDYTLIKWGGVFSPTGCEPQQRVAIVVPYRNRSEHLERFTRYIHRFLPAQQIEYRLFVIEQADSLPFNRARLFNVGFLTILSQLMQNVCCFIFHDVDMLPLHQKNLYMCTQRPRYMSPGGSSLRFQLLYPKLFGGVIAIQRPQLDQVGGFSNEYFGWGGEDDDFFRKVVAAGFGIDRTPSEFGDYHMMSHAKSTPSLKRFDRSKGNTSSIKDGFRSYYKTINYDKKRFYTRIMVEFVEPQEE